MVFDIKQWLEEITSKIKETFKNRVIFIGLQGSYKRGEATKESDIDMVVILDKLDLNDLKVYRDIVRSMPYSEKACGFVSGKEELMNWSKSDMFQFIFETHALYGNLTEIVGELSIEDVKNTVKMSSEALYHATCHSFLFDEDLKQSLRALYKMTFFILQADYYLNNNEYIPTKKELIKLLKGENKVILENCINKEKLNALSEDEINNLYQILITWCSNKIL